MNNTTEGHKKNAQLTRGLNTTMAAFKLVREEWVDVLIFFGSKKCAAKKAQVHADGWVCIKKMKGCSVHSLIVKEFCILSCTKKKKQSLSIFNSLFKLCVTLCTYCMYSCKLYSFLSKDGKRLYKDVYVDCCPTYRLPIYTVEFTRLSLRISHFSSAFK